MLDPTHPRDESGDVRTWANIARTIGRSEKTCRKLAQWGRENRLPVWEDHRGPFATLVGLRSWMLDQILPAGVRGRLRRGRRRRRPDHKVPSDSQRAE